MKCVHCLTIWPEPQQKAFALYNKACTTHNNVFLIQHRVTEDAVSVMSMALLGTEAAPEAIPDDKDFEENRTLPLEVSNKLNGPLEPEKITKQEPVGYQIRTHGLPNKKPWVANHEFLETCHSVTSHFTKKDSKRCCDTKT